LPMLGSSGSLQGLSVGLFRLVHYEVFGFFCALSALLVYRALTGKLILSGLLLDKPHSNAISPERVQLLIATLAVSIMYLSRVIHGDGTVMPNISTSTLAVFGGSSGIYAAVKAAKFWGGNRSKT
jgi:hypothetical protein